MQKLVYKGEVDKSQCSVVFTHPKLIDRVYSNCTVQWLCSVCTNKYRRHSVNGQIFSSNFNSTDRGSIVKVLFAIHCEFFLLMLMPLFIVKLEPAHLLIIIIFCTLSKEFVSQIYKVKQNSGDHIISPHFSRCVLRSPCKGESYYFVCELSK